MAPLCDSQHFSLVFRLEGQEEQSARKSAASEKKRNYVKKPLNAFMLFMKEMRPKVIAECTLREVLGHQPDSRSKGESVSDCCPALGVGHSSGSQAGSVAAMSFLPSVPSATVQCLL